ncbi:DUF262 domain-containing protein [Lysinibacillus agricola]|uniref:DUF262 domain-containing protein n=1 Tax=Lysinibacillus agricola TaxID=2590012 RepID=A0ABX7ANR4_9BACI|nr:MULTISPECIES: DUF262 domain-containing protein [Lysinibacillus]KOS61467.1 hypothetical protein AN161_17910 [Lysinibacillus sp. FJAT-14222]QQP10850.1 DUF262 domain-containing protein [Lysinibacillus agricola]
MIKASMPMSVNKFEKLIEDERLNFDFPIQRADEQWNLMQKSLLVQSLIVDYFIPPVVTAAEVETKDGKTANTYCVLDGKQRITNLVSYFKGEYALHPDTPSVNVDGTYFSIGKMKYEDLPEPVKIEFQTKTLNMYYLSDITEEQKVELYYRLNNGVYLSVHQKNKAVMGVSASIKLNKLSEHPFMTKNAYFTPSQKRKGEDQAVLLQTLMLFDEEYELKSFASDELTKYAERLHEEVNEVIFEALEKAMSVLHDAYGDDSDKFLLRKINLPTLIYTMKHFDDKGYNKQHLIEWLKLFSDTVQDKSDEIPTNYKEFAGSWGIKKVNVLGRLESITKHLDEFYIQKVKIEV